MTIMDTEKGWQKSDVTEALMKNHGQLISTASTLCINVDTLYEYFKKHPDLWDLVFSLRKGFTKAKQLVRQEIALNRLDTLLAKKELGAGHIIRVGTYYLDNLGKEEGFGNASANQIQDDDSHKQDQIEASHENMLLKNQLKLYQERFGNINDNKPETRQELCGGDSPL